MNFTKPIRSPKFKTESIIFDTAQRLKTIVTPIPNIECLGVPITFSDSVHILGVTLDNALTLNKHVTKIVSSCNYHIRALRHISSSLITTQLLLFHSFVYFGTKVDNYELPSLSRPLLSLPFLLYSFFCRLCIDIF